MGDLKFKNLDAQIARVRSKIERHVRERREWVAEKGQFEARVKALEEEIARLAESDRAQQTIQIENAQYRKSQEIVREQVAKMLERIDTFEG